MWPAGLILAVLYGSLLPFEIDWTSLTRSSAFGLLHLELRNTNPEDIITNFLVYVPVGLVLALYFGRQSGTRRAGVLLAVFVGAFVSLLAETLQTGIALRVASWTDVGLNTLGIAFGATVGAVLHGVGPGILKRLRRKLTDRPFETVAGVLTIGLFLYGLAPFDFVTDTRELHASFGRARWDLSGPRPIAFGEPPYAHVIGQLTGAVWFTVLGYLLTFAGRERGRHSTIAVASAVKHGCVLASLVELMQLFTMSHQFDLASLVLRFLAVVFGAWCAEFAAERLSGSRWRQHPGLVFPTPVVVALGVFQVLAMFGSSARPDLWSLQCFDLAHIQWMPFEALWHRPMVKASAEMASSLLTYGAWVLTLAVLLRRARVPRGWLVAGVAAASAAIVIECLRAVTITGTGDTTEPALALIAAIGVARLYPLLRPAPSRARITSSPEPAG